MSDQPTDLTAVPIGTALVYSDPDVRIWILDLGPGAETPLHRHEVDYLYCVAAEGSTETHYADGTVERLTEKVGDSRYHSAGLPHVLRNTGSSTYRNVIVELLRTGGEHSGS